MSWMADFLQIVMSSENIQRAILLMALGIIGKLLFNEVKRTRLELSKVFKALTDNEGNPIHFDDIVGGETESIRLLLEEIFNGLSACQQAQSKCLECQEQISSRPYERCKLFADCPAIAQERKDLQEILRAVQTLAETRAAFLEKVVAATDRNTDVLLDFTGRFGEAVLRSWERVNRHD